MKITDIRLSILSVPLRVPFKTALRTVCSVEDITVETWKREVRMQSPAFSKRVNVFAAIIAADIMNSMEYTRNSSFLSTSLKFPIMMK